jgi:uncharacterized membrane protein
MITIIDGLLVAAFLFFVGSVLGWCTEVLFRRIFTAKKWINPGFLTGPYLPLYGFGVAGLFLISLIPINTGNYWLDSAIIILIMGAVMTIIEYIAGLIFIKGMKIKLWDYTNRWGNIQGIICPLFSFLWLVVCAFYYFVVDPYVMTAVVWFVNHIAFAFFVGVFFGIFLVDLGHSINIASKITAFAKKYHTVVSFEKLKESIKDKIEEFGEKKANFVFAFRSNKSLDESLLDYAESEKKKKIFVINRKKDKDVK